MIPFVVLCFLCIQLYKECSKGQAKKEGNGKQENTCYSDDHYRCPNCKAIIYTYDPCKNLWYSSNC